MRHSLLAAALLVTVLVRVRLSAQLDTSDTRLLQMPVVSKEHVAFVYAGKLWSCDLDGRNPRRLTSDPRGESHPDFAEPPWQPSGAFGLLTYRWLPAVPARPPTARHGVVTRPVRGRGAWI